MILEIIRKWKYFWMNQTQNSEADRKNYLERAFGIDANMMHDLADRLTDHIEPLQKENKRYRLALEKCKMQRNNFSEMYKGTLNDRDREAIDTRVRIHAEVQKILDDEK